MAGERGGSATLRRWYVYGAAFVGLVLLLTGTSGVVESVASGEQLPFQNHR